VSTPLFLSHILIKVDDLPTAVADYERLGFTVTWGSNPTKALNALIHFRAHAFLELFAPRAALGQAEARALAAADHLSLAWIQKFKNSSEGLLSYAVETRAGYRETLAAINRRGIEMTPPREYQRLRPDGIELRWMLSFPGDTKLPFVMSDYEPHLQPRPEETTHANGAVGIRTLRVDTSRFEASLQLHRNYYGLEPKIMDRAGIRMATFDLAPVTLELVEAEVEAIRSVTLEGEREVRAFDPHLTHGANFQFRQA